MSRAANLVRARDRVKNAFQRMVDVINNEDEINAMNLVRLQTVRERYLTARDALNDSNDVHVQRVNEEQYAEAEAEIHQLETLMLQTEMRLNERIAALQPIAPVHPPMVQGVDPQAIADRIVVHTRRDPRPIKFDGKHENWAQFKDVFLVEVHNRDDLQPIEKLVALSEACVGDGAKALGIWPMNAQNYELAWNDLNEKYGDAYASKTSIMQSVYQLEQQLTETYDGLRRLIDIPMVAIRQLQLQGEHVEHWDLPLVQAVLAKAPPTLIEAWEKDRVNYPAATQEQFFTWMRTRAKCRLITEQVLQRTTQAVPNHSTSRPKANNDQTSEENGHRRSRFHRYNPYNRNAGEHGNRVWRRNESNKPSEQPAVDANNGQPAAAAPEQPATPRAKQNPFATPRKNTVTCYGCDQQGHTAYTCPQMVNITPAERRKILIEKAVCIKCGRRHAGGCQNPIQCAACENAQHIGLVCPKKQLGGSQATKRRRD